MLNLLAESSQMEPWQWAERGGWAVAFGTLAWWVSKRIDKSEDRANAKCDSLECHIRSLEEYIRSEFADLVRDCTAALREVKSLVSRDNE